MRFSGIIHPSAFQIKELLGNPSQIYSEKNSSSFSYKNLEFNSSGFSLCANERKNRFLLFDGTFENEKGLSQELSRLGFPHREKKEEILFAAYDAFAETLIEKIEGEFLFLFFDQEKETLFLARDRIGQKGLYWASIGDYFLFSSDIKGLLATGIVPQTPSLTGFAAYLYFGFIPQDMTPVKEVNKLLPAHYLRVDLKRNFHIQQYFSYSELLSQKEPMSEREVKERFHYLLEDELSRILPSDKKIFFDAGGDIVSNALLGAFEKGGRKGEAALLFFDEKMGMRAKAKLDERGYPSLYQKIDPSIVIADLVKMVWELDEPVADLSVLRTWQLSKLLESRADLLVTTIGSAEMLINASRYRGEEFFPTFNPSPAFNLAKLPVPFREKVLLPLLRFTHARARWDVLRNIEINYDQMAYLNHVALFSGRRRKKVSPRLSRHFDPEVFSERFHRLARFPSSIDPIVYFDVKTELPDLSLFQYERLIGSKGIQVVAPFLFSKLFRFFATIPDSIKWERGILTKMISDISPLPTFSEGKEDFLETWRLNPLFRQLFASLEKGLLAEEGLISRRYLRNQLGYPYLDSSSFRELWSLLILEIWMRLFTHPLSATRSQMTVFDLLNE